MVLERDRTERFPAPRDSRPADVAAATGPRIVMKPWGQELIFAETADYAGKLLFVTAGQRLSLQFHEEKHETIYMRRGRVDATIGPACGPLRHIELRPGDVLDVPPGTVHRFEAVEDSELVEVSTPPLDDVVRLSDDYARQSGAAPTVAAPARPGH